MTRHLLHNGALCAAGLALASLTGCGVTELGGRLDLDDGNQSVGAGVVGGSVVEADTVELRNVRGDLLASAEVAADGSFSFANIDPMPAPYIVETRVDGALTGRALGAVDLFADQRTLIAPVSAETSAEAEVFLRLAAEHGEENVDPIGVVLNVSSELAATADIDAMARGAWQAQAAWQASVEAQTGMEPSVEQMHQARLLAFADLLANLDAAADAEGERAAWAEFHTLSRGTLSVRLGLDNEQQANAAAAAALSLAAAYDGEDGGHFALALAADLAARSSFEAVAEDAEAEAEANGEARDEARGRVAAAFGLFFEAVAESREEGDIEQARLDLEAALTGEGESLLAGMLDREGEGIFDGLFDLLVDLAVAIGVDVEAFAESGDGEGAARGALDLRASVDAEVSSALSGEASDEAGEFAVESQFALSVQLGLSLSTDARGEGGEDGRTVGGVVLDGVLGLHIGASGVADGEASIEGDSVAVVRVDSDGSITLIGEGLLEGLGQFGLEIDREEFEGEDAAMFVLEVLAEGEIVGAVILEEGEIEEGGDIESAPITLESTLEALIALELAGEGQVVDRATLDAMIDDAVAGTEDGTEASLDAMAEAVLAAQVAFSSALDTTAEEMNAATAEARAELAAALSASADAAGEARDEFESDVSAAIQAALGVSADAVGEARIQAAVAFSAVVEAQSMAMDEGARAAASARAGLDAAAAVAARIEDDLEGEAQSRLDAALTVFAEAMAEAASGEEVEEAQSELRAALIGQGEASVMAALTASANFIEEGDIDRAAAAVAEAETRLRAQIAAAGELAGQADGALAGQAISQAYAEFGLEANAAVATLVAFDGLSAVDGEAVAEVLIAASAGVFGEMGAR